MAMESHDAFSLAFSHIWPIILKGTVRSSYVLIDLTSATSVALTFIRFLGHCPCPTCLIEKSDIAAMGTKADSVRHQHERVDNKNI